jgi:hypothetical protein
MTPTKLPPPKIARAVERVRHYLARVNQGVAVRE